MTDAARTERPLREASGVFEPFGGLLPRLAGWLRNRSVFEAAALLLPIVVVGVTHTDGPAIWLAAAAYLVVSAILGVRWRTRSGRRHAAGGWNAARVIASVAMVASGQLLTGVTGLLSVVYLPIIALSAFAGHRLLALAVIASIAAHWTVETLDRGEPFEAVQRALGFAVAAVLVAYGTRREVARMHRARRRLRRAMMVDRRRARQIAGVEAVGRILAAHGPTAEALDELVGRVAREFGYRYVSIYLGNDRSVRLGAQRGYAELVGSFDGRRGIVGRVMRTHHHAFAPEVAVDPDYWSLNPDVRSEICVPLLAEDEFLGFVNVESVTEPLDATDLRAMIAIADRLAAALIIGRDRQRLAERADLFRHLHEFSEAVNGTLQPEELYQAIVRSVSSVVDADIATLHVLDRESGRYLLAAAKGSNLLAPGVEARPGEGMAGRAIRDRSMIVDDAASRPPGLRTVAAGFLAEEPPGLVLAAAVPLIRDRAVLGALTLMRADRTQRFSEVERDALAMLGEQSALAVTNVFLHAEVAELALRDPLTGLFNRRYLDPALEQLFARRSRVPVEERVPLAAIMFDLDHFSELNNRHGHQVGDAVLRTFGAVLRKRMRATDLVARFGGEEFAAILYRATLEDAVRIADEIRRQLAATPVAGASGEELSATVSAGCAAIGPDEDSLEALLRAADVALYMAKRAGRDRVCAA
jgi:diguanylate cyclase (GGDEF)-like protein